jgi:Rieske Fe-S protein
VTVSNETSRRGALVKIALFFNGIVGVILAIPVVGYILSPVVRGRKKDESWVSLGSLAGFPEGQTRLATYRSPAAKPSDGETAKIPCWVRRIGSNQFQVFAINCAHLGCPVRWFPQSGLFMCPCHGGVYYSDGSRASGPPERGLFEYPYKLDQGNLLVNAIQMPTPGSPHTRLINISGEKAPCA